METIFIKAVKKNVEFDLKKIEFMKKQKKKVLIFYTSQYSLLSEKIYHFLGRNLVEEKPRQILGCSGIRLSEKQKKENNILIIADGNFHSLPLAIKNKTEVYVFNGFNLSEITRDMITRINKIRRAKKIKFLASEKIGLICSVKKYQCKLKEMVLFFRNLKKEKKPYLFVYETLNFFELENFCLDIYVNFSCPGMESDNQKIINFDSLKEDY